MADPNVLLQFPGFGPWTVSIHMSMDDAESLLDFINRAIPGDSIDVHSVNGAAELKPDGAVELRYHQRESVVFTRTDARNLVTEAIDVAVEREADRQAHANVWDWIAGEKDPRILVLDPGAKISGTVLIRDRTYLAMQATDGRFLFVDAARIHGSVFAGDSVTVTQEPGGQIARRDRR